MTHQLLWIVVHIIPLLALPAVVPWLARHLNPLAVPLACLGAVVLTIATGQALVVSGRGKAVVRWAVTSALGLILAFLVATVLSSVLDARFPVPEVMAIGLAHGAGGVILGIVQARRMAGIRGTWVLLTATGWLAGAAIADALYAEEWMPGRLTGAFFGRIELTTLVRLLPIYAIVMVPLLGRVRRG